MIRRIYELWLSPRHVLHPSWLCVMVVVINNGTWLVCSDCSQFLLHGSFFYRREQSCLPAPFGWFVRPRTGSTTLTSFRAVCLLADWWW
jgi:hypothetical protein